MRNTSVSHALSAPAGRPAARHLTRLLDAIGHALRVIADETLPWWQQHRFGRGTDHALHELDARSLRDIGIDRSEIPSIAAAAGGSGDPTRVRTTHNARCLSALL